MISHGDLSADAHAKPLHTRASSDAYSIILSEIALGPAPSHGCHCPTPVAERDPGGYVQAPLAKHQSLARECR